MWGRGFRHKMIMCYVEKKQNTFFYLGVFILLFPGSQKLMKLLCKEETMSPFKLQLDKDKKTQSHTEIYFTILEENQYWCQMNSTINYIYHQLWQRYLDLKLKFQFKIVSY